METARDRRHGTFSLAQKLFRDHSTANLFEPESKILSGLPRVIFSTGRAPYRARRSGAPFSRDCKSKYRGTDFARFSRQDRDTVTLMLFHDAVLMAVDGPGAKLVPVGPPNRYEEVASHPNVILRACRPCVDARGPSGQARRDE
jgi:hypothetical protein